jgi:lipopolysaccharide transport system ATP-binding protein
MSDIILKAENLSKQYRLGYISTNSLKDDFQRWWAGVRGQDDPFLKIGETNSRSTKGISDYVWALKDINFEVKRGEVLGIIGGNGAGKSTLLKLLSKVTGPTTGHIKVGGNIASLLEVGTGFHPELTGKENIYLNGAMLGMSKQEIRKKFDEIVDFAGVERYIDTPVKRYSSGMYVRLAFAVAAHLEPDILIVDEVLAVGDAEFQKKAIGKMKEVSEGGGRTVLFVSHNMGMIEHLCNRAIQLQDGLITFEGTPELAVKNYFSSANNKPGVFLKKDGPGTESKKFFFEKCLLLDGTTKEEISYAKSGDDVVFRIFFTAKEKIKNIRLDFAIDTALGLRLSWFSNSLLENKGLNEVNADNNYLELYLPNLTLPGGRYLLTLYTACGGQVLDHIDHAFAFQIEDGDFFGTGNIVPKDVLKVLMDYDMSIT